jgi:hypothetical protein
MDHVTLKWQNLFRLARSSPTKHKGGIADARNYYVHKANLLLDCGRI